MTDKFDKPIGKWITEKEEIEIPVGVFDPESKTVSETTQTVIKETKVIYEKPKDKVSFCEKGEHVWRVYDSRKYIIKCENCPIMKRIMVGQEYIDKEGRVRRSSDDKIIA